MPKQGETSATVRRPSESFLKSLLNKGKFSKQKPLPPQVPGVSEEVAQDLWAGGVGPDFKGLPPSGKKK